MRCVFTTEQPEYILSDRQNLTEETYIQQNAELEAFLKECKQEGDIKAEEEMERRLDDLEYTHRMLYIVPPENASNDYQIAPYLQVLDNDGYGFLMKNAGMDLSYFEHGRMDVNKLVQKPDHLLDMKRMEEQERTGRKPEISGNFEKKGDL